MKVLGIIVVILIVVIGAWFWFSGSQEGTLFPQEQEPGSQSVVVEITASGFSPKEFSIHAGGVVDFVNKDSKPHWPASAVHPVHQCYPGFDALKPVQPGETYSYKFMTAKTCKFHDHLNPSLTGSITVE